MSCLPLPFFLFVFCIVQIGKSSNSRRAVPEWASRVAYGSAFGLLMGWPLWSSLSRLAVERLKSAGSIGGWNQGRIPLPSDFWGFFNWLPSDGVHNIPRGFVLGIVEVLISLFILYFAVRSRERTTKNYIFASLFVYLIFMFFVYRGGTGGANNYSIWKMSAYFSGFMILAIASTSDIKFRTNPLDSDVGIVKTSGHKFSSFMLILALLSTVGWSVSWIGSRQFSFLPSTSKEQRFFDKYDVQLVGYSGANIEKFILQGDVHYAEPTRAFNIPAKRSSPSRPLAYVVPSGSCQSLSCIEAVTGPIIGGPLGPLVDRAAIRKNKIVNGDFKGWSHGTYFDKSGVTADNWYWSTNDVGRIRQERFGKGEVPVASEASPFYLRWSIKGDSQNYEILQKISNVRTFAGQTVALSFWARQTVGSTTFQTRIFQDFGSGGSPSPLTQAGGSYAKLDVTKSWKRFIQVFTIPKISGKTIGSNGNSYLWVSFQAGSKAAGQLDLWRVQLVPIGKVRLEKVYSSSEFNAYE